MTEFETIEKYNINKYRFLQRAKLNLKIALLILKLYLKCGKWKTYKDRSLIVNTYDDRCGKLRIFKSKEYKYFLRSYDYCYDLFQYKNNGYGENYGSKFGQSL